MKIPSRTGVTAGVTAGSDNERAPSRRARRATVAALVATGLVSSSVLMPGLAVAAVPTFPDNVVVFPDRDFVSIEGYQDHVGETATVTVNRGGQVVGQATATVAPGDVAFEVNHPGGVCWGAGAPANLQVTPNIVDGDVVTLKFTDGTQGDTTVSGGVASDAVKNGTTVTVTGKLDPDFNPAFVEQRIINPDMVDLIGKRDVRALPGPLTPAPKGGYSSGMDVAADGTYTATYQFDTQEAADAAANAPLGERLMAWQEEDLDANRQGLTIAEFGEAGGPGMGGCPAGPTDSVAQAGSVLVTPAADKKSAKLTWTPATAAAGASPVTNYSVLAIAPAAADAANGQQTQTGFRFNADARTTTIDALDPAKNYTFEVRSISQDKKSSAPFTVNAANAGGGTQTPGTAVQLTLSPAASADGNPVTASSVTATTAAGTQIWFAADAAVFSGGALTDAAQPYTAPIPITKQTTLHFAALNADNNIDTATVTYVPGEATAPATPTGVVATGGQLSAQVRWQPVTGASGYEINVTGPTGPTSTTVTQAGISPATISNLAVGTYSFTVTAVSGELKSPPSEPVTAAVTAVTDRVTISTAKWKANDFRVTGTGSQNGVTVRVYRANTDGTKGAQIGTLSVGVAVNAYDWRLRAGVPATNPGRIVVESSAGGLSAPFTVTNG